MNTHLVLITSGFPYGTSEPFLETEIKYLSAQFERITILCPETRNSTHRPVPSNCSVVRFSNSLSKLDKIQALFGFLSPIFRKEMFRVRSIYKQKISLGILKIALMSLFQAKRIVNEINQQIRSKSSFENIICYSYWCDNSAIALALLSMSHPNLKTVSRAHGWDVYFHVHPIPYLPYRSLIQSNLTSILPISEKGKHEIENTWKVNSNNVQIARLGVSSTTSQPTTPPTVITVVSCSNVIPLKRVLLLASAIILFQQPIRWVHFGDGPELQSIKNWVKTNQKDEQMIEFRGQTPNQEIRRFYAENQVTAFINVSTSEGIPVSIMEAMSFGIPVVATNVGGTSEIVNNQNGVLLSENPTPHEIKAAIEEVIAHPEKGEIAYETWKEKYNAEKNYTEFVNQLKSI